MAKEKFDRSKPHVNVGTNLVLIIGLTFVLSLNLVAKENTAINFDSANVNEILIFKKIDKDISNFPKPVSSKIDSVKVKIRTFRVTESGQEVEVFPEEIMTEKNYYKFKPNDKFYHQIWCPAQSGLWNFCVDYKFYPEYGGHNHNDNVPPYTTWEGEHPIPLHKCYFDIPVETTYFLYRKAPKFATRSEKVTRFWGACGGTLYNTTDIKIDGLELLKPAHEDGLYGGATYYKLIGEKPWHPINHFGKIQTLDLLKEIAWQYHSEFPNDEVLNINDISLRWGGLFDVKIDSTTGEHILWVTPHKFHRYGRQADLRLRTIPAENRARFIQICRDVGDVGVEVELHSKIGVPLSLFESSIWENTDFNLPPWNSFSEKELDMRVPHYHLVFPKYDNEVDNPVDQIPQNCSSKNGKY